MDDPGVQLDLEQAWVDSNPNAPEVPRGQDSSLKAEEGGWIYQRRRTGDYLTVRIESGTRDSLSGLATGPIASDKYDTVGWFHTHPNTAAEGYSPNPSGSDKAFTNWAKIPGVIMTHNGIKYIPYD